MPEQEPPACNRVIAYIDGFNLYHGIKEQEIQARERRKQGVPTTSWQPYLWLNLQKLVSLFLKKDQTLVAVRYFTARVDKPSKQKKQGDYIEALETLPNLTVHYGKYQVTPQHCPNCQTSFNVPKEKMTDVRIAVEFLSDAHRDAFDVAFLLSADSDLAPVIQAVRELHPNKKIVAIFPPSRYSKVLEDHADAVRFIKKSHLKKSTFPKEVRKVDGFILVRPKDWSGWTYP